MTLCEMITNPITRMVSEGKNLDDIAEEICPKIEYGREKIIRIIKDFLGEEYLIQHAETLKYDVGYAQLAKKRKHRSHEKLDAGADSVVESASITPIASCQTTVQAVNTEHVKEAQAKGQEQEKVLEVPGVCYQEKSAKAVQKKKDSEAETTGQIPNYTPVENKFEVLVEILKNILKVFTLDEVKKALAFVESDI